MFKTIRQWKKEDSEYRRAHNAAFDPVRVVDPTGLSVFQRRAIAAIGDLVPPATFSQQRDAEGAIYLTADIPATQKRLYLYRSEAAVLLDTAIRRAPYWDYAIYEEWDFRTPEELIHAVRRDVRAAMEAGPSTSTRRALARA